MANAFIFGGASGIGKYLAKMYMARGYGVAIFDLVIPDGTVEEIKGAGKSSAQKVAAYKVNVCEPEAVVEVVAQAVREIGNPDDAINSAGIQRASVFTEQSYEEFRLVIEVNLLGSRNFAAAIIPHLRSGARLVLVASMAGLVGSYTYGAYSASKFGVVGLAGCLRVELKPVGISVSVVCPPEIDTPMVVKELETMHPVTRELKDFAGSLTLDEAMPQIWAGIQKRKFVVICGFKAKLTHFLNSYLPESMMHAIIDGKVNKVLKGQKT